MHYTTNEDKTFGFIWNVVWNDGGFVYGTAQIIIGDHIYPKALPSDDHYTFDPCRQIRTVKLGRF